MRERFEVAKLRTTISRALRGLDHADSSLAQGVESYVLWALRGQQIVRTSQLSTLIAETLRGVHDIAYLRWVMIGKELDHITVYDEAVGLVRSPSKRHSLIFQNSTSMR